MSRQLTEADVIALATAVAGEGGGGGTGDGDMKMSVYDADEVVKDAGGIPAYVAAQRPGEATTVTAGLMSASDKSKLNDIESGAEVNVQSDWSQSSSSADDFIKNKPDLGDLAFKDSASATYTPAGSISVSQGTDTTTIINPITDVGTLPSFSVSGEVMTFNAGELPTAGADTSVVTASGTRTATFSGTQATITST